MKLLQQFKARIDTLLNRQGATMTPTEQDKELRVEIVRKVYPKPTPREVMSLGTQEAVIEMYADAPIVHKFANFITADRKRVALEARKDQTFKVIQSLVKSGSISDGSASRALMLFDAELKAQQEKA